MARITPLSGFPEWLPRERLAEQQVLDTCRDVFELHGFTPIETRAVEPLDQLLRKGETDKEIYVLRRLQADTDDSDAGLGLHFDLTVPFARYVLEHAGRLEFPLRRYQIQKAWRGERPQEGRYREFLQADIDVVDRDRLPWHYEVELPLVIADLFRRLPLPPARMRVNNRKVSEGFYRGLGIDDPAAVLRIVDKLDKIGAGQVIKGLVESAGCTDEQARACVDLAAIRSPDASFVDAVNRLGVRHELLDEGLEELRRLVAEVGEQAPGWLTVDLSIARGLDYYTGAVYETTLTGHEHIGSVCSGGRYDALASDGQTSYPGVGLSLGVTRLLGRLFGQRLLGASRAVPTCVLVALPNEDSRRRCNRIAAGLRERGIAAHVAPEPEKYGRQIRYAERRGIPFVWFPQPDGSHEVRDIRSGEQHPADPDRWQPPEADRRPQLVGQGESG